LTIKSKSQRVKILEYIARKSEAHYKEIAKALGLKEYVVRGRLSELTKAGFTYRVKPGSYRLTGLGEYYIKNYLRVEKAILKAQRQGVRRIIKDRKKDPCLGKYYVIVNDGFQYKTIVFKNEIDIVKMLKALKRFQEQYDFDVNRLEVEEVVRCYEV